MRDRNRGTVALMILRAGGYWEFPKGKREKNESDRQTAERELKEETDLEGMFTEEEPLHMVYQFERDGETVRKEVTYFFCRLPDGSTAAIDRTEANDSQWLALEDLAERATYPEMKEVARQVPLTLAD